jgi:hypothetical protein
MPSKNNTAKRTFRVTVMRPVFQIAMVEVDARTARDAVAAALDKANDLPDAAWAGSFDAENYTYDVQDVIQAKKLDKMVEADPHDENQLPGPAPSDEVHYLLLKGSIEFGEGEVIAQPWLVQRNDLMISDLAGDWAGDLETIRKDGFKAYLANLVRQHGLANVVKRGGNVIPFSAPTPRDQEAKDE